MDRRDSNVVGTAQRAFAHRYELGAYFFAAVSVPRSIAAVATAE